jgi:hypothetical protein
VNDCENLGLTTFSTGWTLEIGNSSLVLKHVGCSWSCDNLLYKSYIKRIVSNSKGYRHDLCIEKEVIHR